jgi:uncharacterized protein
MARLIWWLVMGALAWWVLRRWLLRNSPPPMQAPTPSAPAPAEPGHMVACAHCGLHLPEPDAIRASSNAGQVFYCGAEHARANDHHPDR